MTTLQQAIEQTKKMLVIKHLCHILWQEMVG